MNEYGWTFTVIYQDKTVNVVWEEKFHKGNSMGYWLDVIDPTTGDSFQGYTDDFSEKSVRQAAIAFRVGQIKLKTDMRIPTNEALKEAILELFERSENGEYLGQYIHSSFYVQDVARILDYPMSMVVEMVDELVAEGKLGLTGMILIPNKDYIAAFKSWEESTGHKRLTVSDFGYWGCAACGKNGDSEGPDSVWAADTPCV